ncbi:MAG: class I SAM-dependent methyltransferase [Verrucomicrobia bacterium]|nr:class I SAM-dependent methyltransferase [Verrucomicrobiota bacterium]
MIKARTLILLCMLSFRSLCAHEPYQDIFVNGSILAKGSGPDCASRYEALKTIFALYKGRPFTMLDIGAAEGYFSFRAAHDFGAHVVIVGDPLWNDNILEKLCRDNNELHHVELISKRVTPKELKQLAKQRHFDIVLALNVLHHFEKDWKKAYKAILRLGDNIIIETPPNGDKMACGQPLIAPINRRINKRAHRLLGRFQRHTDETQVDRIVVMSGKNY